MDALENILTRRSFRAFKNDEIARSDLEKILDTVRHSPSYMNTQPWEVAVVLGSQKEALSKILMGLIEEKKPISPDIPKPSDWPDPLEARLREHGARRLKTLGIERDDQESRGNLTLRNYEFYSAPCALFVYCEGGVGEWSVFDLGLFTQSLVLAASALGIGSCIQASVVDYAKEIKQFLAIPVEKKLIVCISIGYPDREAKLNEYQSLKKEVVDFVKWYE